MQNPPTWIDLDENRAAAEACARVRACRREAQTVAAWRRTALNPLFVHGPAGCGKTRLVEHLLAGLVEDSPSLIVARLAAADLHAADEDTPDFAANETDLVVVEDLQHLRSSSIPTLTALLDRAPARRRQLVLTATVGPAHLDALPRRLTSRLGMGLVVGIDAPTPASRERYLRERAAQRGLPVAPDVLAWVVASLPGSLRQLEGALTRLETLARGLGRRPTLDDVAEAFRTDADAATPTLDRIIRKVGDFYRVSPERLCSQGRSREVMLPRQVGMYLARQLTPLPLERIGAYFGGRDHSTVLHACRKIETSLADDAALCGAVRLLRSELA